MITRRNLLIGLAAPAIIRVADIMPVRALAPQWYEWRRVSASTWLTDAAIENMLDHTQVATVSLGTADERRRVLHSLLEANALIARSGA